MSRSTNCQNSLAKDSLATVSNYSNQTPTPFSAYDVSNESSASSTQQDAIYLKLRHWITVGHFLPGERLKIRTVARQIHAGEMPVRAALQRLAAEGALINIPNAGVAIPRLSLPELDDLLQMRLLLEGEAAEKGSIRLSPSQTQSLLELCHQMEQSLNQKNATDYLAANEDFHVILYKAAGSPLLFQLIDTLWLKAGPISNQLFDTDAAYPVLNQAHQEIVLALKNKDSQGVRRAVEKDIFVASQLLRSQMKKNIIKSSCTQ